MQHERKPLPPTTHEIELAKRRHPAGTEIARAEMQQVIEQLLAEQRKDDLGNTLFFALVLPLLMTVLACTLIFALTGVL